MQVRSLAWEDPWIGGGHGNPFHILACGIPWTEEPGGLQSMSRNESDTTEMT